MIDKNLINQMYEVINKKFIKLYNYNKEWYEK